MPAARESWGLVYLACGMLAFTLMNGAVRQLSGELHPVEIAFFRVAFGLCALTPFLRDSRSVAFRTKRLKTHALRAVFSIGSLLCFFMALTLMPLAKVSAAFFSTPVFVTVLAGLFLREKIGPRRIVSVGVGLLGVLLVVRPDSSVWHAGTIFILASALFSAATLTTTKALSRTDSGITITLYDGLFSLPIALIIAIPFWTTPDPGHIIWLVAIGILGTGGLLAVNRAFKEADAIAVIPAMFTKLIWAALLGYVAFGEIPDAFTWGGAVLILCSVGYTAFRERAVNRVPHS